MPFHHDGYVSGDPRVEPAAGVGLDRPEDLPETVDALIVGAGPAGMTAFAQLSQFPNVVTRLIERRAHRLEVGQADGLQARSIETFQAFGFANRLVEESYRIYSMAFWKPDPADPAKIVRTVLVPDDPSGVSEFPHVCLNQARVQDYFAEFAANSPSRAKPDYGVELLRLEVTSRGDHPVNVDIRYTAGPRQGETRTIRARYVVGCDGARSSVREAVGRSFVGQSAMHAWGSCTCSRRRTSPTSAPSARSSRTTAATCCSSRGRAAISLGSTSTSVRSPRRTAAKCERRLWR